MNCIFCKKECKRYTKANGYEKLIHYKCKFNFEFHTINSLISFGTDKYDIYCYLQDDEDTIINSELYTKDKKYHNVDLAGLSITSLAKDNNYDYLNDKIETILIYG